MPKRSWPHPVLDSEGDDYLNCAFQAAVAIKQTRSEFIFQIRMDLSSETLLSAISRGDAVYALQIHCPRTSFRQAFKFQTADLERSIPEHLLRDLFSVRPYIVASKGFILQSPEFNPIFDGMQFQMAAGYVLAIAPSQDYTAEKSIDDLQNIRAIFQVRRQPNPSIRRVELDLMSDRIAIILPQDDFDHYSLFRTRKPYSHIFVCSLVLPALHAALLEIKEDDESAVLNRWRRVLKRRLEEIGKSNFAIEDTFGIAQDLLEMPYGRAFLAISQTEEIRES
jgi:hypothetical protein